VRRWCYSSLGSGFTPNEKVDIWLTTPDRWEAPIQYNVRVDERGFFSNLPLVIRKLKGIPPSSLQFATLDDAVLWRAAQTQLPANVAARLEELHLKRQREGLTGQQESEAAALIRQYERAMLIRAPHRMVSTSSAQ